MLDSHALPDLNILSIAELRASKGHLEDALSKSDLRRRHEAINAARRSVEEFGFSLEEILASAVRAKPAKPSAGTAGHAVKFRNPKNPGETWSGRGRRPGWLARELAAGRSQDEFRA